MRIIYMGTPEFAVEPLRALIRVGHEICAVVTQPDKWKGRSKEPQMSPVKQCALEYGIPVLQPVKIRLQEEVEKLAFYEPELIVVAAFGQILSKEILTMPKWGCINIHASLLPKYRGAAPIQQVILDGEAKTGVTIMQMDIGLDTGDILFQKEVPITEEDTSDTLHDKLSFAGAELIVPSVEAIEAGNVTPIKQQEELSCYAHMIRKEMGAISFENSALHINRQVRGLDPWPSAYTSYQGKTLKIWKCSVLNEEVQTAPGTVCRVEKDAFCVSCGSGVLRITEVQLEGKKRMAVRDFLLGCRMKEGELLG